jgi:hypothetical protein
MMSEKQILWIEEMCRLLAPIERETLEKLGEETGRFFLRVTDDWLKINSAVMGVYPGEQGYNLVLHTFLGLFKEVYWFQFFFVSGNYPLLLSRVRFVWESIFRAYLAENYPLGPRQPLPVPGPSLDDKVAWLEKRERERGRGRNLNWDGCIEPVLRSVFPLADREKKVRDFYQAQYKELHQYVHPSVYLGEKMIGESALHVIDNFDDELALEAIRAASNVFDLVWLTVLRHHPLAFERVESLCGGYPILKILFEDDNG